MELQLRGCKRVLYGRDREPMVWYSAYTSLALLARRTWLTIDCNFNHRLSMVIARMLTLPWVHFQCSVLGCSGLAAPSQLLRTGQQTALHPFPVLSSFVSQSVLHVAVMHTLSICVMKCNALYCVLLCSHDAGLAPQALLND